MALRRRRGGETFTSWAGDGSITIGGGGPAEGRISAGDAVVIVVVLVAYDFAVLLFNGLLTSSGSSQCIPSGCTPDPAYQVHRATVGAVVYAVAALLPVVVALVRRRAVLVVVVVQAVAAAVFWAQGAGSIHDAHANLHTICSNVPPQSVVHECH